MENIEVELKNTHRCPKCNAEYNVDGAQEGVIISFPQYAGAYCLQCWAEWISKNIPKLEPLK